MIRYSIYNYYDSFITEVIIILMIYLLQTSVNTGIFWFFDSIGCVAGHDGIRDVPRLQHRYITIQSVVINKLPSTLFF